MGSRIYIHTHTHTDRDSIVDADIFPVPMLHAYIYIVYLKCILCELWWMFSVHIRAYSLSLFGFISIVSEYGGIRIHIRRRTSFIRFSV